MTLWIQPLFGTPYELPFFPPDPSAPEGWRPIYTMLSSLIPWEREEERVLHQLRLIHRGSFDLSDVKEGDHLRLLVTERMVERWVSEYDLSPADGTFHFWHSTMSWYDGRWGDPYETPTVYYRTPLTLHVVLRIEQATGIRTYQTQPDFFPIAYGGGSDKKRPRSWYATLRDALRAFQTERANGVEMTDKTLEHLHHLWGLYHGTNQHLVDQGRWYM